MAAFLLTSFLASVAGAICGIGGGVIIKPVLDFLGLAGVSTISFLSGCTVLSMSCYSVAKSFLSGEKRVDIRTGTPLAIGAAVGGIAGKQLFSIIKDAAADPNRVGGIQAICLAAVTLLTLICTLRKANIRPRRVERFLPCLAIGLALGLISSFLGIGGGPINLIALFFFFAMDTKTAAANSLYVILFSQAASLITTLVTRTVPAFEPATLALMVAGGILGGVVGRVFYRKMREKAVNRLFIALMAVIICISLYNAKRYLGL